MANKNEDFYNGKSLIGDNFSRIEIEKWYNEEQEAYANLGNNNRNTYRYQYHDGNKYNGYRYIHEQSFDQVLGLGSAYGDEFLPIVKKIKNLTILEPSEQLQSQKIGDIIPVYIKPNLDGTMEFEDHTFDLITCFGVLHHVPNVSHVLSELIRVLKPGGYLLIKEPISTMGDWNETRVGLTKNERGIPLNYFSKIFQNNGVKVLRRTLIDNLAIYKMINFIIPFSVQSRQFVLIDRFFSYIFEWNYTYHRTNLFRKIAPGGVFFIVTK